MNERTIDTLERELHGAEPAGTPDLPTVHRLGDRRRRARTSVAVGGVAAAAVVATLLATTLGGGATRGRDVQPAGHPDGLIPLAQRALAEVPGATQVSDWQVVLPAPSRQHPTMQQLLKPEEVDGAPVALGAHHYAGVTMYRPSAFPTWLHDGVEHIEKTELGDDNGYPVGSTEMGILVDTGQAYLGCVGKWSKTCSPALLTQTNGRWAYEWGMGTDEFLKPGSDMEVFLSEDYSAGSPGQVVLAGLPGLDVARVDLVTTDGRTVSGHVESGTVVPDQTMMWGRVPGKVASVVAYDASGEVIEDHELSPCDSPVDCEVR